MSWNAVSIVGAELDAYIERKAKPPSLRMSSDPFEIDIAMCCVARGDVEALGIWTEQLEASLSSAGRTDHDELVSGLKCLHSVWKEVEAQAGNGALLDFRHCLKSSPPNVVGRTRIENAERFQQARNRVAGDPRWAFDLEIK